MDKPKTTSFAHRYNIDKVYDQARKILGCEHKVDYSSKVVTSYRLLRNEL